MWFTKWFGGRTEPADDEPARYLAPPMPPDRAASATHVRSPAARKPASVTAAKGFDPYNSGAFERRNAWERIPRR